METTSRGYRREYFVTGGSGVISGFARPSVARLLPTVHALLLSFCRRRRGGRRDAGSIQVQVRRLGD